MEKVVCTLACRVQSTRLYSKPLQLIDIDNKISILDYLISQLQSVPSINQIVLAISEGDENKIFERIAKNKNLDYIIGDEQDVLCRLIDAGKKGNADIIFRVTSECPFLYLEGIELALKKHIENKADLTVIEGLPEGAYFELINLSALEKSHQEGENRHRSELCTLYINEHPEKFNIQKIVLDDLKMRRPDIRVTVDYPEDLIVARELYKALKKENKFISIKEIIDYLDSHQSLKKVNDWIDSGQGRIWA